VNQFLPHHVLRVNFHSTHQALELLLDVDENQVQKLLACSVAEFHVEFVLADKGRANLLMVVFVGQI
jgi:hypothetical protein